MGQLCRLISVWAEDWRVAHFANRGRNGPLLFEIVNHSET